MFYRVAGVFPLVHRPCCTPCVLPLPYPPHVPGPHPCLSLIVLCLTLPNPCLFLTYCPTLHLSLPPTIFYCPSDPTFQTFPHPCLSLVPWLVTASHLLSYFTLVVHLPLSFIVQSRSTYQTFPHSCLSPLLSCPVVHPLLSFAVLSHSAVPH